MRIRTWIWLGTVLAFGTSSHAASVETIDLKAFVRPALFESIGVEWTLPHGRQVLDGTPFQIDGEILLYRTNSAQKALTARTNVNNIPVGRRFERLHLLAGAESSTSDGAIIAKVRLSYADGSNSALDVRYGDQVRNWYGPWHKKDKPLKDPNAREVWLAQCAAAAAGDNYLRPFHVTLTQSRRGADGGGDEHRAGCQRTGA